MSTTAVGPLLNIDGPLPRPPEYRLLSLPGVLAGTSRWLNGVQVWSYPCDTPSLWQPCNDGTFDVKGDTSTSEITRFDAFTAYLPFTCSTISAEPLEFARRAEAVVDATLSFAVEEALSQGIDNGALNPNPYFGDVSMSLLAAAAVSPTVGLSYLEAAIGATGRQGIIHAPPAVVAAWGFEQLSTEGGVIRTPNGTPVASGGGYAYPVGEGPVGRTAVTAGTDWAFVTGPVEVFVTEGVTPSVSQFVDHSDNTATYRAEREVAAVWDACLQGGVLIDWDA